MDTMDSEVLETAISWHQHGHAVMLGTVVKTWGSAPRPVGSLVALRQDGHVKGSVSGGCIEDDLMVRVWEPGFSVSVPTVVTYGISADEAHRFGLPCGGTMQIVVEPIGAESGLEKVLEMVQDGQIAARSVDVSSGRVTVKPSEVAGSTMFDGVSLQNFHGPAYRLLIIGAGQLSEYVARLAIPLGFRVMVCDPREEYLHEWDVAHTELFQEMPDDLINRIGLDANSAVVALTHDPKIDDLALMEALRSKAFYVGAIGSRANSSKRRERLKLLDLSGPQVLALHAPIGMHIGAQTPPEIAVAIMAEVISCRNHVPVMQTHALREHDVRQRRAA
jgi:xanthine dehydrogenase accessory factor